MYCTNYVTAHLLRGASALVLILSAIYLYSFSLTYAGIVILIAVILMRGCPMCWLMGLLAALNQSRGKRPPAG